MAFVSVGQKYGFESSADYYRKLIAAAEKLADEERQKVIAAEKLADEERQKVLVAQEKADNAEAERLDTARKMVADKVISLEKAKAYFGYSEEQLLAK